MFTLNYRISPIRESEGSYILHLDPKIILKHIKVSKVEKTNTIQRILRVNEDFILRFGSNLGSPLFLFLLPLHTLLVMSTKSLLTTSGCLNEGENCCVPRDGSGRDCD